MKPMTALAITILALSSFSCSKAEPTPTPMPTPAATSVPTPTATPVPTPTTAEKRAETIRFLKSMNILANRFEDAFKDSGVMDKVGRGDLLGLNSAVATTKQQLAGYVSQLNELEAPLSEPELRAILSGARSDAADMLTWWEKVVAATHAGNQAQLLQALENTSALEIKALVTEKRVQDLMARYNIPDVEVGYRRP